MIALIVLSVILSFFLGGILASATSCLIWRRKQNESWVKVKRSHCDVCNHELNFVDLIPVFGYLIRKGSCKYCGKPIPRGSFLTELTCSTIFALVASLLVATIFQMEVMKFVLWNVVPCALSVGGLVCVVLYAFKREYEKLAVIGHIAMLLGVVIVIAKGQPLDEVRTLLLGAVMVTCSSIIAIVNAPL